MTNNIEEKPSNKKLWLTLGSVSAVALIGGLAFWGVSSSSDSGPSANATSDPSQQTSESISDAAPIVETVSTTSNDSELLFAVKVEGVDTTKRSIEYQIADQNRVVKDEGKAREAEFEASVKISDSAYYRIKVRAIDDGGATTAWSESYTVKLADVEGFETAEPSPEYFGTPWAEGTNASLSAAKEAIEVAWNIEEISDPAQIASCIPINSGDMSPGLLLPPIPSVTPKDVTLKYIVNDWDDSGVSINYVWC